MAGLKHPTGQYNRQVQVQARVKPARLNELNEEVVEWEPLVTRWARIEPLSGREFWNAQQSQSAVTHLVSLRGVVRGLTTQHRLQMGRRIFNIESIIDLNDEHYEHELRCIERADLK